MKIVVLAFLVVGCHFVDPIPPQPHGGTCESEKANLEKLGGCTLHLDTYIENCHAEEEKSGVPLPHDCVTEAKTCEEALVCT